jgi:NAD(P)-dependent dehydrogenase (short-subunit alcohol dehydrogenase family)
VASDISIHKKVVAITGAGSGIGRALAVRMAKEGSRLALADIDKASLHETLSMLPGSTEARTYLVDVSSRDAVFGFADDVVRDFGSVDYVVNNAGTAFLATFEHITLAQIDRIIAVNLWGVIYGSKAFLEKMLPQRSGCIVNISSVFGLIATPCSVAYTISKFGVRGLTETLWQELDGTGVCAVLVHPGGINTNISNGSKALYDADFERKIMKANLTQMTTTPDDCADQIVRGLLRGHKRLLVGNSAKTLHLISRLLPNSYGYLIKKKLGF